MAKKQKYSPSKQNDYATGRFRQIARMCLGKRIFNSEKHAKQIGDQWGHKPYQCPQCHKWHLTSRK